MNNSIHEENNSFLGDDQPVTKIPERGNRGNRGNRGE